MSVKLSLYGASQVSQRIESFASSVRTLAATFSGYTAIPPANRRGVISTQVRGTLVHQPRVLAAWAQWEPGAIGDDPAPYRKTALSTESGAFDSSKPR